MEFVGDRIAVKFNLKEKTQHTFGNGLTIEIATDWEHAEGNEAHNKLVAQNVNRIDVNPQTAEVVIAGENPFFAVGDKIFTHYMAYEDMEVIEIDGEEISIIDTELIIFKVIDGKKILPDGFYLGDQIMEKEVRLDSGLFINVVEKKKSLTIKITDVPEKASHIKVNDIIQSIDDYNYPFEFEGKKYIFIKDEEIVAKVK